MAEEELFDAAFLDRLRMLAVRLRKRRQLMRRGNQSTPSTGYTREFKDYRHYTPKEDYRAIDWRLYARLDKLFVRIYAVAYTNLTLPDKKKVSNLVVRVFENKTNINKTNSKLFFYSYRGRRLRKKS